MWFPDSRRRSERRSLVWRHWGLFSLAGKQEWRKEMTTLKLCLHHTISYLLTPPIHLLPPYTNHLYIHTFFWVVFGFFLAAPSSTSTVQHLHCLFLSSCLNHLNHRCLLFDLICQRVHQHSKQQQLRAAPWFYLNPWVTLTSHLTTVSWVASMGLILVELYQELIPPWLHWRWLCLHRLNILRLRSGHWSQTWTYSHVRSTAGVPGLSDGVHKLTTDSKITQLDVSFTVHQNVGGFDVCSHTTQTQK